MKKFIVLPIVFIGMLLLSFNTRGQDPNYTQYFSTPIYYNPAYTGINSGVRARFAFRDQWPSLPVDYKSYFFSADVGDRNLPGSGGLGLYVNSNNYGKSYINDLSFGLSISVRIPITALFVSQIGIKAAVVQHKIDYPSMVFGDELNEKYGRIYSTQFPVDVYSNKKVFPDFGIGGLFQFANPDGIITGTGGFAVDHIFQPDEAFLSTATAKIPRKYVAHLDLVISTSPGGSSSSMYTNGGGGDPLRINPGFLYQSQGNLNSLVAGFNILKYNLYLGAWYRTALKNNPSTAVALVAGYKYTFAEDMSLKFMYSYDLQISSNLQGLGGAHEISLILEFDKLSLFGGGNRGGSFNTPGRSFRGGGPLECPSFY